MSKTPIIGTVNYELIGYSKDLVNNVLPTNRDVLRGLYFLREEGATAEKNVLKRVIDVNKTLAEKITNCWVKASIPQIYTNNGIIKKVGKLYDTYRDVIRERTSTSIKFKFIRELDVIFDICTCKCPVTNQDLRNKMLCSCAEESRLLRAEVPFLTDQRGPRIMKISPSVDAALTTTYHMSRKRLIKKVRLE